MNRFLIFASVASMALAGCSNGDNNTIKEGSTAIDFRGTVDKTRASLIGSTSELTSFFVQAYQQSANTGFDFLNAVVYKEGTSWLYSPQKYYPGNGEWVNFYAYAPVKDVNMVGLTNDGSGGVSFSYTVPVAQNANNTSVDLLVSAALGQTAALNGGNPIAFTFDHALSAVTFSVRNTNDVGSELVYTIESVSILGMDNVGTFTYNPLYDGGVTPAQLIGAWSDNTAMDANYLAGVIASNAAVIPVGSSGAYAKVLSDNDYMMVLPQTVIAGTLVSDVPAAPADGAFVAVKFSLRDGSGSMIYDGFTRYIALNHEFEMGNRYNFQIDFGVGVDPALVPIELTVTSVNGWVDNDQDLP